MPILSAKEAAKRGKSPPKNANTRRANAQKRMNDKRNLNRRIAKLTRKSMHKSTGSAATHEAFARVLNKEANREHGKK